MPAAATTDQRGWWLRVPLVLQSPRAVFVALRDESDEAVEARQEPITALVFLAGIAGVLAAPRFGTLLDDPERDDLLVVLIAVAAGGVYALLGYWVIGLGLTLGSRAVGGDAPARRFRHVLAFAAAPLVLSLLVVWPLRLALYGSDVFRSGGSDSGAGAQVFEWVILLFVAWSIALLVLGVRTVQGWSWAKAAAASLAGIVLAGAVLGLWVAVAQGFT